MRQLGRTSRLILTVLAKSPAHGYGVISWVSDASGGTERLAVGSVYGSLDKLESKGLIERDREEIENGRTRQYFRITDSGLQRLSVEVAKLAREVAAAQEALQGSTLPGIAGEVT